MLFINRTNTRPMPPARAHVAKVSSPKRTFQLLIALLLTSVCVIGNNAQTRSTGRSPARRAAAPSVAAPQATDAITLRIMAAEDTRQWNEELAALLESPAPSVRTRAALAAGRIGAEAAVAPLVRLLRLDSNEEVRATAAFALGEIESGADALLEALRVSKSIAVRARAVEALGKIAAALPEGSEIRRASIGDAILPLLEPTPAARKTSNTDFILAALTAVLRARPTGASASVQRHLTATDKDVRATALNTLARLRVTDANLAVRPLLDDADPVVRANAARVLGASGDQESVDALVSRITNDRDERVRISAIRALAGTKDARAAVPLRERFSVLLVNYRATRLATPSIVVRPVEANELLEIVTALGTLLAGSNDVTAMETLRGLRDTERLRAPEIETALARISPARYLRDPFVERVSENVANHSWQTVASVAEGIGEVARQTSVSEDGAAGNSGIIMRADALIRLRQILDSQSLTAPARPTVLRALAAFNQPDFATTLAAELKAEDVYVRATAAELLGDLAAVETIVPEARDAAIGTLAGALPRALEDAEPDGALAILTALGQQPSPAATAAIESALGAREYLARNRAATLLEARSAGASPRSRVGTVASRNDAEDYARALARRGKRVLANVTTDKGAFTIELLPAVAPLTVDNFVQLAGKGFFNNISFHRVVPNFVIQSGDPRGDGNGGPGYAIRCEINTVPYAHGAVGMALSGKDTGGSQWFVTHSPQPHLDGGYTVFGQVISGLDVVDRIARGDRIREVRITETVAHARPRTSVRRGAGRGRR